MAKREVYKADIELPNRAGDDPAWDMRTKYFLIIRDNSQESDISIVIASTDRRNGNVRGFEVLFPADIGLFPNTTVVDCRWVYTISRNLLANLEPIFIIPEEKMKEVKLALALGLELI